MLETLQHRNRLLRQSVLTIPGSVPYSNYRPINVPGRLEGRTLLDCLSAMHPHIDRARWIEWFQAGHILRDDTPVPMSKIVRGGEQYQHLFPGTVEPDVDTRVEILWEDDSLIAVHKPAPLPVHPCGRFNLNTLTSLLRHVYDPAELKLVHRLDANTTGLMLLARDRKLATRLRKQFEKNGVRKRYLVRCAGHSSEDFFVRRDRVARYRIEGGLRVTHASGDDAETAFRVIRRHPDQTTLLEARPTTGRTNQIRIHLWAMRMPVVGDPAYLKEGQLAAAQTLSVEAPSMCLHASSLSFKHPATGRELQLTAPSPQWADI